MKNLHSDRNKLTDDGQDKARKPTKQTAEQEENKKKRNKSTKCGVIDIITYNLFLLMKLIS